MQTLSIYQIPIMPGYKQDTCSYTVGQLFLKSCKQTLVTVSSNHSEIFTLYKTSREYA
jgi:hypothetical protein